jgi:uncharacterized protein YlxP (DUF503 family)
VTIGVFTFELHLPLSRSLKQKRQVLRRLKDRLRSRYNVAVSELNDHSDLWQRASVAVVSVAHGRDPLERLFESVYEEAAGLVPGQVIEQGREFIESADGGDRGWSGDWE